jgi:hypothetical protein
VGVSPPRLRGTPSPGCAGYPPDCAVRLRGGEKLASGFREGTLAAGPLFERAQQVLELDLISAVRFRQLMCRAQRRVCLR